MNFFPSLLGFCAAEAEPAEANIAVQYTACLCRSPVILTGMLTTRTLNPWVPKTVIVDRLTAVGRVGLVNAWILMSLKPVTPIFSQARQVKLKVSPALAGKLVPLTARTTGCIVPGGGWTPYNWNISTRVAGAKEREKKERKTYKQKNKMLKKKKKGGGGGIRMLIEGALERRHKLARKRRNCKLYPSADFVQLFYQYPPKNPFCFEF